MAGASQESPQDSQNVWQRIPGLVREALLGYSGPRGCETHSEEAIEKITQKYSGLEFESSRMIYIPPLIDMEVRNFLEKKRTELWNSRKALAMSVVQQQVLPSFVQEFEPYYVGVFLKQSCGEFYAGCPENRALDSLDEWLKELVKRVVETMALSLRDDSGELSDEQLVKLYRAGFPRGKTLLLERYNTKLPQLASVIVCAKGICPDSADPVEFSKDVAQETSLKLMVGLDSYHFESSFKTWVGTICENEAYTQQRKLLGRSKEGKRKYISFDELEQHPEAPRIRNEDHREILRKIIDKHRQQGPRAVKSADAIEWRYFEGIDSTTIAERLQTSLAYVHQLFSHDYPELRRIGMEDFGISGTDL